MKKLIIFLLVILTLNVNAQTFYNKYTSFNPYNGQSQTYNNKERNDDNDGRDRRFELGIIIMGVGLVTMLAATYSYTSYSYNQNYYNYGYSYARETDRYVFFTGVGLSVTGLTISLANSGKKSRR